MILFVGQDVVPGMNVASHAARALRCRNTAARQPPRRHSGEQVVLPHSPRRSATIVATKSSSGRGPVHRAAESLTRSARCWAVSGVSAAAKRLSSRRSVAASVSIDQRFRPPDTVGQTLGPDRSRV